ncbi:MAG: hypothetical protein ACI965_002301, partial [Paraglaciecola sp.]
VQLTGEHVTLLARLTSKNAATWYRFGELKLGTSC